MYLVNCFICGREMHIDKEPHGDDVYLHQECARMARNAHSRHKFEDSVKEVKGENLPKVPRSNDK